MSGQFRKNISTTQRPGSTAKLMTALVFQDWVSSGALDTIVSVTAADTVDWETNSNAGLLEGDQISYRDLLYGMMLPSGNDAAKCIARNAGALIIAGGGPGSSGDPATRYLQAMNAKAAVLGLPTAVFADVFGVDSGNLMSADDLARLMVAYSGDAFLVTVGGTLTRTITITGVNARTYDVTHTIDPDGVVPIPEFIAGKTGRVTYTDTTLNSGGCLAVLWESPTGIRRVSALLNAGDPPAAFQDLRKMIDYELARLGEL